MAENTKIEWADHTFNPWTGCTKVSPGGCANCYAESWSKRAGQKVGKWGPGAPRVRTSEANWRQPLKWNAQAEREGVRYRVFCASLADVFDNEVPTEWRGDLWTLINATPRLDWLLLTKRIGNVKTMMYDPEDPQPNVWIGATIVNQEEADRDIPKLLAVPAAKRFLSMEPLLGPVDLSHACAGFMQDFRPMGSVYLDWVIVGGESGPNARPMHPDWARSLRDQCAAAGVPFLFKQWGKWAELEPTFTRTISADSAEVRRLSSECDGFISLRGEFVPDMGLASRDEPYRGIVRSGKKSAGRQLDGRTWDEVPS